MITGIILMAAAWIIFTILSFISLFFRHGKRDWYEFEIDDLSDLHVDQWFWNDIGQFIYRTALVVSFVLFAIGVIIFSLNCCPEWGMSWVKVLLRLIAAFFGYIIVGRILSILGNAIAITIPLIGMIIVISPMMLVSWWRGRN